ncbi:MAG: hypothetical protein EA409_05140 [Saprospirales bacterium]|nr:MAG: hypothetical protein EA409_05140 [Saprospirales bacterium]
MDLLLTLFRITLLCTTLVLINSCNSSSLPNTGKLIIEVKLESTPDLRAEEQMGMTELEELFQSGHIAWYFSPEKEAVLHDFLLMGQNFLMRDIIDKERNIQTILIEFLSEKIAISKTSEEFKRERGEVLTNYSYFLDRERTKEILGCSCVAFEGYIEMGQQIINHSGYLCEELPMTASFIQGLDINPLPGALFEVDVNLGSVNIQYRAVNLEKQALPDEIFEYDLSQYQLLPAGILGQGNIFNPFN